jgi:Amt family ammonium transporter
LAIDLKFSLGFDDSLDVVGIHLVGGLIGTLWIGVFGNGVGLAFGNGWEQLGIQALGSLAVLVYSFVMALAIGYAIEKTIGFRVKAEDEIAGIDTVVHGELAYSFGADKD